MLKVGVRHTSAAALLAAASTLVPAAVPSLHALVPASTASVPVGGGARYTVQPGDTLGLLAAKTGANLAVLATLNKVRPTTSLRPGQQLSLPRGVAVPPAAVYVVGRGETVASVARRTGVSSSALASLNRIRQVTAVLRLGLRLTLPAGGVLPPGQTTPLKIMRAPAVPQYVTVRGDTVGQVAARMKVSVTALVETNKLGRVTERTLLAPGTVLKVPTGGVIPVTGQYLVQRGDSWSAIASRYGLRAAALTNANPRYAGKSLRIGLVLVLPGVGAGTPATVPSTTLKPTTTLPSTTRPTAHTTVKPTATTLKPTTTTRPSSTEPGSTVQTTTTVPAILFKLRLGDSPEAVAARAGVRIEDIYQLTGINKYSVVYAGMTLRLPLDAKDPSRGIPSMEPLGHRPADDAAAIERVIEAAKAQLGDPYMAYAAGPNSYDCSGLTLAIYRTIGISLPHYSVAQARLGKPVDPTLEPIRAGDLIFTASSGRAGPIGHVMVAVNQRTVIHAPRSGDVVRYGSMPALSRIVAIRRFVGDVVAPPPSTTVPETTTTLPGQ